MRFVVDEILGEKILRAATLAEEFIGSEIHNLNLPQFTHTTDSATRIVVALLVSRPPVQVFPWRPLNPFSSAIATTFKNRPGIFVNTRKISARSTAQYVGTLCHEYCHIVGYSHGSNNPRGKQFSVPYWFGYQAEVWAHGRA